MLLWLIEAAVFQLPQLHKHSTLGVIRKLQYVKRLITGIILIIFAIHSCKGPTNNNISTTKTSSNSHKLDTLKQKLIGKWGSGERAVWEFKTDSLHFLDRDSAYLYQLKGDTLAVRFPDRDTLTEFGKVNIIRDTLFLRQYYRDNFIIRAYRYKD